MLGVAFTSPVNFGLIQRVSVPAPPLTQRLGFYQGENSAFILSCSFFDTVDNAHFTPFSEDNPRTGAVALGFTDAVGVTIPGYEMFGVIDGPLAGDFAGTVVISGVGCSLDVDWRAFKRKGD